MWAPGTYLPDRGEGDAVHANIGVEKYFFEAGDRILNRIKEHPQHGDPAGADGPDRGRPLLGRRQQRRRALVQPRRRSRTASRRAPTVRQHDAERRGGGRRDRHPGRRTGPASTPATRSRSTPARPNEEVARRRLDRQRRTRRARARTSSSPQPLVARARGGRGARRAARCQTGRRLPAGLRDGGQARGARVRGRQLRAARVGARRTRSDNEAAAGADDRARRGRATPIDDDVRVRQRAVGDPLHDRRVEADASSPLWDSTGPREPGEVFHLTTTTTFRWMATDIKGNVSTGSRSSRSR